MTGTSTNFNRALWTCTLLLTLSLCYAMLVVGDYILARRISSAQEKIVSAPDAIEIKRSIEEDIPQRAEAIKSGYKALIYPDVIERNRSLNEIAKRIGIAPLAPHPLSNLYYCNEGYGLIKYKSDRFGFRNDDALWDSKKRDIVLIGDSFTHGACVSDELTIGGVLGKHWNVLNLASGGNNPVHYAAIAKTFLTVIKPSVVIIVFYANDNDDRNQDSLYYKQYFEGKAKYFEDEMSSRLKLSTGIRNFYLEAESIVRSISDANGEIAEPLRFFDRGSAATRIKKYLKLPNIRQELGMIRGELNIQTGRLPFSSQLAIDTLVAECKAVGCVPIVTYIPNSPFWSPDPRSESYSALLGEYAKEVGVKFLDNTTSIRSLGESAYASKGKHLSPAGYNLVARNLATQVQ